MLETNKQGILNANSVREKGIKLSAALKTKRELKRVTRKRYIKVQLLMRMEETGVLELTATFVKNKMQWLRIILG